MIFPVQGGASYTNDWGAPRSGHTHQGNDLFGPIGRPLVAVDAGEVKFGSDPLGGNVANLKASDGTKYYYAHLDRFDGSNRFVIPGEIIGYLGKTGNASTTAPHLHFEIHPKGGGPVNPYPLIKEWQIKPLAGVSPISVQQATELARKGNNIWAAGAMLGLGYLVWRGRR